MVAVTTYLLKQQTLQKEQFAISIYKELIASFG